ncbi:MAG: hypothetical protein ACHWZW_22810 [Spirulina sp.]
MDKKERLEKEIEQLKATLDKCFQKRLLSDDPEKEIKLEELEERLESQIREKERKLSHLSSSSSNRNRGTLTLKEELCSLDFDEPKKVVQDILTCLHENEGGSALLLAEKCLDMEGELLLIKIRDILKSNTSQLIEYPVQFIPTMPANRMAFLKTIAGYLGIDLPVTDGNESEDELTKATEKIVGKLSERLRSGTTIFIPVANWKSLSLSYQSVFLDWFICQFWQSLNRSVSMAMNDYSPRVFCIIMVDESMAEACKKADYFCDTAEFDCNKLLMLPLRCWTKTDVRRWLSSYSSEINKTECNRLVDYIFGSKDEELPWKVRAELEKAHAQSCF